jgi:phage tail-like protein
MATNNNRAYAAAHFGLELDGKDSVGLFRSVEGGGVRADVMTHQVGGINDRWRQIGKPKFEDIKMQVGMSMSLPFFNWMSQFMAGTPNRKNGAIVAADFYYNERARRDFKEAMIKEVSFPKLDGSDKNAAYLTVTLAVEDIEFKKGSGKKLDTPAGWDNQKLWTACNFRLNLDKFPGTTNRVTKIDSFTIKQNTAEYHGGGFKHAIKAPTVIDYPNITFYVPEADAFPFKEHLQKRVGFGSHVGKGEVRPGTEFNGSIETFDNANNTLFTVQFFGADLTAVTPDRSDASSEEIKQVKIEMFTERMNFIWGGKGG